MNKYIPPFVQFQTDKGEPSFSSREEETNKLMHDLLTEFLYQPDTEETQALLRYRKNKIIRYLDEKW